jgi:hypothetical protein
MPQLGGCFVLEALMSKVRSTSAYEVYGFMRDDLHLSGERLVAYAVIHQFTVWQGAFMPNYELIADWLECNNGHAIEVVNSLVLDGICEQHNIGKRIAFTAVKTREDY